MKSVAKHTHFYSQDSNSQISNLKHQNSKTISRKGTVVIMTVEALS